MATMQRGVMRHPKIAALSDAAFRLWMAGNDYCDELLTNGIILKSALASHGVAARATPKIVAELLRVVPPYQHPLWEDLGDRYQIHDYLHWNDSREVVQANRARVRQRVANYRLRRAQESEDDPAGGNGGGNGNSNGGGNAVTNPVSNDRLLNTVDRTSNIEQVPPLPPLTGGRVTRRDLDRAADIRRRAHGRCPHQPPCANYADCLHRIARDQQATS